MSESNEWFRGVWNRFDKLKKIEDSWFDVFNDKVENQIINKHLSIDKKFNKKNYGKK